MTITNGIYSRAELRPSPNKGGAIIPDTIIVHDTAGGLDAAGSIAWLSNPQSRASAHFVIGRDGKVFQLVSTNIRAWHAGESKLGNRTNVNGFSIGIEFVNPGLLTPSGAHDARAAFGAVYSRKAYKIEERPKSSTHPVGLWMPYTQAQLDAGLQLCLDIRDTYNIKYFEPHWFISPGRKIDTNPLFPLISFQGRINGRVDPLPRKGVLREGGFLPRRWPSFFESNIIRDYPQVVDILGNELHEVQGEAVPEALRGRRMEWTRIRFGDTIAFVDPADITEVKP